jgi:hypothetical protein
MRNDRAVAREINQIKALFACQRFEYFYLGLFPQFVRKLGFPGVERRSDSAFVISPDTYKLSIELIATRLRRLEWTAACFFLKSTHQRENSYETDRIRNSRLLVTRVGFVGANARRPAARPLPGAGKIS